MEPCSPSPSSLEAASEAIVKYALHAFTRDSLPWSKDALTQIAEFVWNARGRNLDPSVFWAPGGDLSAVVRRLCEARRAVPAPFDDVMLFDLDFHCRDAAVVFTFELSWDEGANFLACEITVDGPSNAPAPPAP